MSFFRSRSLTLLFTLEPPWRSASYFLAGAGLASPVAALFNFLAAAASTLRGYFFYILVLAVTGFSIFEEFCSDGFLTIYEAWSLILGVSFFLSSYTN